MNFSVAQVAKHFDVDPVTVRRWIKDGCPCVRKGRRGPGRGAILDIQQVADWRGNTRDQEGLTIEIVLPRIASALCETLMVDRADISAGIDRASTVAVLLAAFERCCCEFGKSYRFDQPPQGIRTLMYEL